jgi:hypothetical protein
MPAKEDSMPDPHYTETTYDPGEPGDTRHRQEPAGQMIPSAPSPGAVHDRRDTADGVNGSYRHESGPGNEVVTTGTGYGHWESPPALDKDDWLRPGRRYADQVMACVARSGSQAAPGKPRG